MSEEGEIWRAFKEEIREIKAEQSNRFKTVFVPMLNDKYSVSEFHQNSFRIKNEDGKVIDYFPSSGKYHVHSTGFRGRVHITKCIEMFEREFKK